MKKRIWIVIKLRFFINLEIIEEEDKKKKLYLFLKKIYKYCYNLRHIRPLFFFSVIYGCYNLRCIRPLFLLEHLKNKKN